MKQDLMKGVIDMHVHTNPDLRLRAYDDFELILDFYTQLIGRKTGRQPEENILFPLRLYCRGSIDMTVEWIFAPKERTPEQMAALLVSALPMPVTELFQQLGV